MGVYPFMFGSIKDFEPVVEDIVKVRAYSRLLFERSWLCFPNLKNKRTTPPTLTGHHGFQTGLKEPYDWDEYAEMFFPKARELADIATGAEKAGEKEKASEYYLSVSCSSKLKGWCLGAMPG